MPKQERTAKIRPWSFESFMTGYGTIKIYMNDRSQHMYIKYHIIMDHVRKSKIIFESSSTK